MQDQQHQASIYSMNPGSRGVSSSVMEDRSAQMPVLHPEDSTSLHNGLMPPHRSHFDGHSAHLANSHHYAMIETSPRAPHGNPTYFYDSSFTSLPDPRLAHPLSITYQDHTGVSPRQDPSRSGHAMNVDEEFRFFSQDPQSTISASQTPSTQPISGRTRNKEMRGVGNHAAERATTAKDEEEVLPPRKGSGASRTAKGSSASAEKVRGKGNTYHQAGRPDPVDAISTIELNQRLVFPGQPKNGPMHHMPALGHVPMHHIHNSGSQAISSPSASTTMGHTAPQRTPNNGVNFVVKSLAGKAPVHPVDLPSSSELSPHALQQLRQQQMLQHQQQQLHAQQSFHFASGSHSIPPTSSNPISTSDAHSRITSQQRHPLSASTPALMTRSLPSPASTSHIPSHSSSYATFPASSHYHNSNYGGNSPLGGTSARTGISTLVLSDSSGSNTTTHMTSPLPNVSISTPRQYTHEMQRGIAQPQQSFQQHPHFAPYHAPSQMPYQPRQQTHNQFQAQHYQRHHPPQATSTRSLSASSPSVGSSASQNHYNASVPSQETVLWVNYLPLQWNEETIKSELQALLEIHGAPNARVLNVALHPQLATESLNRTLATITLPTKEDCETAMQILRHCKVQGKILSISFQQPVRPLESEESLATTKTLFVANVHLSVTEEQIRLLFMQFGEVVSAVVVKNQNSNQSRGFVFVEYAEHASCELALRFLQNENFCGQPLKIKLAKAQTQTPTQLALPQKSRADSGSPRGTGGSASTPTTPTAPYPSSSASSTFSPSTSPMAHSQTPTSSNSEQPTSEKFKLLEPQQRKVVFTVGRKRASSSSSSSPAVNASSSLNSHSNLSSGAGSESPMSNVSPISSPLSPSSTPRSTPRFQEPHHAVSVPSTADRRRLSLPTRPAAPGAAATSHSSASHDQQARATVPTIWYSSGDGMSEGDSHMGTN